MNSLTLAFLAGVFFGALVGASVVLWLNTNKKPTPAPPYTAMTTAEKDEQFWEREAVKCSAQRALAQKSVRNRLGLVDHGGHIDYNEKDAIDTLRAARNMGKQK